MRKQLIIGPLLALFYFSTTTAAVAPSTPREIDGFRRVEVPSVVIRDFRIYPRDSFPPRPQIINQPEAIIKNLTEPKPVGYSVADARRYALDKLGAYQYSCIDKIFDRESNWRVKAHNSSSGAYGIPQALPGSKMGVIASDWRTNAVTQVKWGIRYVNGRYGSACAAWRFHQNNGWY